MDNAEEISNMLDNIVAGDNIKAQDDFNSIIATKMTQAIDARKMELAQKIYQDSKAENGPEQEEEPAADDTDAV